MLSALGHCEDLACKSKSDLVRLFRCTIHCDRLLCLYHLNAHNIYYEEEKKQNHVVLNELQNNLTIYQTIFEQHLQEYRDLVHQASSLLLQKSSTLIPIEQIRPVLERIQRAIAIFQQETIIIKSEPLIDENEIAIDKIDSNFSIDSNLIKKDNENPNETNQVVVRLQRIDCQLSNQENHLENEQTIDSIGHYDEENIFKGRKPTDENQKRSSTKKKSDKSRKKKEKPIPLKRLQN